MNKYNSLFERRKKRLFAPAIFFALELVLIWLVISIPNMSYDIAEFNTISIIIMALFVFHRFSKMTHIYERNKKKDN